MNRLKEIIIKRRSYYNINDKSFILDTEIKEIIDFAMLHVPSAYNSQSTRIILLLNENHKKLWSIIKTELKKRADSEESFAKSKEKIERSFESGHGTILFYEDQTIVEDLKSKFKTYSNNFPVWSEHTSAMHQYAIWLLLIDAGFGASLQHYNPIIDEEVAKTWNINPRWKLIAQMPFGIPTKQPDPKEFSSLEGRSIIFE